MNKKEGKEDLEKPRKEENSAAGAPNSPSCIPRKTTAHFGFSNPQFLSYLISAIQILFANNVFCRRIMELQLEDNSENNGGVLETFLKKLQALAQWSLDRTTLPLSSETLNDIVLFSANVAHEEWGLSPLQQHDPLDFIKHLLNYLDENFCNKFKKLCQIHVKPDSVDCTGCGNRLSSNAEVHTLLDVSFCTPDEDCQLSVYELMTDKLDENIELKCQRCSTTQTTTSSVLQAPDFLLVHLLRYEKDDYSTGATVKIHEPVYISKNVGLRLSEETPPSKEYPLKEDDPKNAYYVLNGVVNHLGDSTASGHCTAMVLDEAEGQWVLCDDDKVKVITQKEVIFNEGNQKSCYIVSYKRVASVW